MKLILILSLFVIYGCRNKSSQIEFQFDESLIVPIIINKEKINFLFDTGATHSIISEDLAHQLGLDKGEEAEVDAFNMKTKLKCYKSKKKAAIQIGNFSFNEHIYIRPLLKDWKSNAVLGMDILERLHWVFDFQNSVLTIDDKEIPDYSPRGSSLSLLYHSPKSFVEISIWDSSKLTFTMDTGYSNSFNPSDNHVLPDFIMYNNNADSICKILTTNHVPSYYININQWNYIMSDTFKIETKQITYPCIGIYNHSYYNAYSEKYRNLITLRFITRFSKFTINPTTKCFTLFLSDDDTSRNNSEANQNLYDYIKGIIDMNNKRDVSPESLSSISQCNFSFGTNI